MESMVMNKLEISIRHRYISFAGRKQPLEMENYLLIHMWDLNDLPYALCTEGELRTIHQWFENPSIPAAEGFLVR